MQTEKIPADPKMPQPTGSDKAQRSEKATTEPQHAAWTAPTGRGQHVAREMATGYRADTDRDTNTDTQMHWVSDTMWTCVWETGAPGRNSRRRHLLLLKKCLQLQMSQAVQQKDF